MTAEGHLYLSGFMAVGKSTVGLIVADSLSRPFVDLDHRIERAAGRNIPALFTEEGETGFRRRERQALQVVASEPASVVALGGGAMVDASNRALARQTGLLLTLTAQPETLRARMDTNHRPLASRMDELLIARSDVYSDCDFQVATDGRTPAEVAEAVLNVVFAA